MLAYLSRYTHRVAIANSRLIAFDEDSITVKWKDYRIEGRDRYTRMTLATLSANAGYDAIRDFAPISLIASSPLLIFAHPSFPASDIKATIALAKEKPGTISYATPGLGSIHHLSMELLAYLTGTRFVHVPYRGGAPALNDVLGGHVPLSVLSVFQALPHLQSKAVRPLAVTSAKATDVLPGVPSLAEVGVNDYEAELWYAVIAPSGAGSTRTY